MTGSGLSIAELTEDILDLLDLLFLCAVSIDNAERLTGEVYSAVSLPLIIITIVILAVIEDITLRLALGALERSLEVTIFLRVLILVVIRSETLICFLFVIELIESDAVIIIIYTYRIIFLAAVCFDIALLDACVLESILKIVSSILLNLCTSGK